MYTLNSKCHYEFIVVFKHKSRNNLNNDLKGINKWNFLYKNSFNLGPTKQAQEVMFSRKTAKNIVIRNGKIVWRIVIIEDYLRLNLSCQR